MNLLAVRWFLYLALLRLCLGYGYSTARSLCSWGGGECWHGAPYSSFFGSTESKTFMTATANHALQRIQIESATQYVP